MLAFGIDSSKNDVLTSDRKLSVLVLVSAEISVSVCISVSVSVSFNLSIFGQNFGSKSNRKPKSLRKYYFSNIFYM
jgi:hypothetical protein